MGRDGAQVENVQWRKVKVGAGEVCRGWEEVGGGAQVGVGDNIEKNYRKPINRHF